MGVVKGEKNKTVKPERIRERKLMLSTQGTQPVLILDTTQGKKKENQSHEGPRYGIQWLSVECGWWPICEGLQVRLAKECNVIKQSTRG